MMTALGQAQGPDECGTLWSCVVGSAEESMALKNL